MIKELATITSVDGDYAWVQTQRESACESCSAQKGCGTSAIGKVVGKQYTQVRVINSCAAKVGDLVKVALPEDMLLKSSLAVYLVPLMLMMIGGVLGDAYGTQEQWMAVLGSLVGLSIGVVWLKLYAALMAKNTRFQPTVEQIVQSADSNKTTIYTP